MSVLVTAMGKAHLARAYEIHKDSVFSPWKFETFEDCTLTPYEGLVALQEGHVAGYALLLFVSVEVTIMDIAVNASKRGTGVGKALMDEIVALCQARQREEIWLEVRAGNNVAIGLYKSFGFDTIEIRKGYYPATEGREDAVIMKKCL